MSTPFPKSAQAPGKKGSAFQDYMSVEYNLTDGDWMTVDSNGEERSV